ncbi:hypothetical protein N6H18_14605 [Reichenbachiella agarivorans]|uniref:Outer membrane protein beta-barrel domain-containing protein n=1 Tax=Reichenbachiella agarivorans TaxID=2979464 RepID=A0ABY6CM35_9BACT|nr:hypothetical protein [Reichenbachiella agarivorans]UXP31580.1 hypothetical protein N6H18_14605 [Reichenbachiella agarivorans]
MTITFAVQAQEYEYTEDDIYRSPVRAVLNMFSFTVSTGYNAVTYKHDLSGYYLIQSPAQQYIAVNEGGALGMNSYTDWLNNPRYGDSLALQSPFLILNSRLPDSVIHSALQANTTLVYNGDSLNLGFKRTSWAVPLNVRVRFNYKDFRVGGGVSLLYQKINSLKPTVDELGIRNYEPNIGSVFQFKYFGMVGYKFLDFWDYSFAGEIEFGKDKYLGSKFNKSLMDQSMFFNLGISVEKNLSEYFRVVVKPSYDFRSYGMAIPGTGTSIKHSNPSFNINFGVSITIPEIPRSPMKSDHVQLKHVIVDPQTGRYVEVRGQPIWKVQNPKVGQNHRKLWRYKFKNKRKMNPY